MVRMISEFVHHSPDFFRICWCWFLSFDVYTAFETFHNSKPNCSITKYIKDQMMGQCLFKQILFFTSSVVFSTTVQYSIEPFFQLWGKISSDANRWVHTRAQYDCFSTPSRSQKPGQKNKYFISNSIPFHILLPKRVRGVRGKGGWKKATFKIPLNNQYIDKKTCPLTTSKMYEDHPYQCCWRQAGTRQTFGRRRRKCRIHVHRPKP